MISDCWVGMVEPSRISSFLHPVEEIGVPYDWAYFKHSAFFVSIGWQVYMLICINLVVVSHMYQYAFIHISRSHLKTFELWQLGSKLPPKGVMSVIFIVSGTLVSFPCTGWSLPASCGIVITLLLWWVVCLSYYKLRQLLPHCNLFSYAYYTVIFASYFHSLMYLLE